MLNCLFEWCLKCRLSVNDAKSEIINYRGVKKTISRVLPHVNVNMVNFIFYLWQEGRIILFFLYWTHCFLTQNMFAQFIYYLFKVIYKPIQGWVLLKYFLYNPCQYNNYNFDNIIN